MRHVSMTQFSVCSLQVKKGLVKGRQIQLKLQPASVVQLTARQQGMLGMLQLLQVVVHYSPILKHHRKFHLVSGP